MPMPGVSGSNTPYPAYPLAQGYHPPQNYPYPYPPTNMYPPSSGGYLRPAYPPPTPPPSAASSVSSNYDCRFITLNILKIVRYRFMEKVTKFCSHCRI